MTNRKPPLHPDPIINKMYEIIENSNSAYERFLRKPKHANLAIEKDTQDLVDSIPVYINKIIAPKYPDEKIQTLINQQLLIWSCSFLAFCLEKDIEKQNIILTDRERAETILASIDINILKDFNLFACERTLAVIQNIKNTKGNVVDILEYKDDKKFANLLKQLEKQPE